MSFIYQSIVFAEERYLEEKFGDAYRQYCAVAPRWSLRLSRLRAATDGMRFNLRKAILAEYTTIATSLAMLAATEIYEQLAHADDPPVMLLVELLGGFLVLAVLWTFVVRRYKKRRAAKGLTAI